MIKRVTDFTKCYVRSIFKEEYINKNSIIMKDSFSRESTKLKIFKEGCGVVGYIYLYNHFVLVQKKYYKAYKQRFDMNDIDFTYDTFCLVLFDRNNDNELYRIRCTEDCYLIFQSMWHDVEKLKRDRKVIEQEFDWLLKKYSLTYRQTTEYSNIYSNKEFELKFMYSSYLSPTFYGIYIGGTNYDVTFNDIIDFMQKYRNESLFSIGSILITGRFEKYSDYFKSHLIPFLELAESSREKLKMSFYDSLIDDEEKYYNGYRDRTFAQTLIEFSNLNNATDNFLNILLKNGDKIFFIENHDKGKWLVKKIVKNNSTDGIEENLVYKLECFDIISQCYKDKNVNIIFESKKDKSGIDYTKEINKEIKYIEDKFGVLFKQFNMELKKQSRYKIIFGNDKFGFAFEYNFAHMNCWELYILLENQKFTSFDIINFIQAKQNNKNLRYHNIVTKDGYINSYPDFFDTHFIPFFSMSNEEIENFKNEYESLSPSKIIKNEVKRLKETLNCFKGDYKVYLKRESRTDIVFGNNLFNLIFLYETQYSRDWMNCEDILIEYENDNCGSISTIMRLVGEEKKGHLSISYCFEKLESTVLSFLNLENYAEKLDIIHEQRRLSYR